MDVWELWCPTKVSVASATVSEGVVELLSRYLAIVFGIEKFHHYGIGVEWTELPKSGLGVLVSSTVW